MKLDVRDSVRDFIRHCHPVLRQRIRFALKAIIKDHACGKPLTAELAGLWSYRVGKVRIIYRIIDHITDGRFIEVVNIGPRTHIYEMTYRLIQRDRTIIHDG